MDRKLVYSAYGALILAAGAFGVHIGESAIGQINPLYYQGAAVHPRDRGAAIDAGALAEQSPRFAELYGWDEGAAARSADCVNCEALAARDAYASPNRAVLETGWRAEPRTASAWAPDPRDRLTPVEEEPSAFEAQRAEVGRYAAYQIEEAPEGEPVEAKAEAETTDVAGL
ncbi:MAG TPA: hypothetical protein VEZ20_01150 [Allosphingosinicella sp.]|jgi:hypothetical protein|nr:hypothetical protein [Allosphingosinicella sp.]